MSLTVRSLLPSLVLVSSLFSISTATAQQRPFAPGQLLVGFRGTERSMVKTMALNKVRAKLIKRLGTPRDENVAPVDLQQISVPGSIADAMQALSKDPAVMFVELNYLVRPNEVSNDASYVQGALWGMYGDDAPMCGPSGTSNAYGIDAEEAWSLGVIGSRSVYVGIVDEGVQFSHPDLAPNVWTNPYDVADGVDNDGNGFIDDIHGWDFYNDDNSVYDAGGDSHGTHVAGTIGAVGGNGAGVAGVNWNVTMIPAKFLGADGGYLSDAIDAINYLRDLKKRHGLNIVALNNSWGGGGYSASLHTAILRAAKDGILFVAAAGNEGFNNDIIASYPSGYTTLKGALFESAASYESVISVAAITSSGGLAYFSNYGATTVDIGAPGLGIVSTVPAGSYISYSGTSMATPHVTGAIALYASAFPLASPQQIRQALLSRAAPTASLAGRAVTGGRLTLNGMFASSPTPTPPPTTTATPTPPPGSTGRDVAVTSISAQSLPFLPNIVTVSIKSTNLGSQKETFVVAVGGNGGTAFPPNAQVSLEPGKSATSMLLWVALRKGTYTLTGAASVVQGETNTANNSATTTVTIR